MTTGGSGCIKLSGVQIALFRLQKPGGAAGEASAWHAVQNLCPHDRRQVLSSGLTGDAQGEPKVACPLHKNAFSLATGAHLDAQEWRLETFPVKEVEGAIYVEFNTAHLTPPAKMDTGVSREPGDAYGHGLTN